MRMGILLGLLACPATAAAQPGTTPPAQPAPQPYPYPYYYPPPPPPPPKKNKADPDLPVATQILFHGLCPTDTEPACGGGLWMGLRGSTLAGAKSDDTGFGLALDIGLGFSFGFGWEVGSDIPEDERDSMAFVTAIAEAAVGPGLRTTKVDILPAIGLGGEAVAWGTTDRDDDPYSEGYWYATLAAHVRLPGYTLLAQTTRKFETDNVFDVYQTGLEAGIAWFDPKDKVPIQITIWYQHFDTHTIGGLAFGIGPDGLVKPRVVDPTPPAQVAVPPPTR